jgi:Zn-dependent metalloprotease
MTKVLSSLIILCYCSVLFSQNNVVKPEGVHIDFVSESTNMPLQVSLNEGMHISQLQFNNWMSEKVVKNKAVSFSELKSEHDALGFSHQKYQQYYKGYKVEDAVIVSHSKNSEVKFFNGEWFSDINLNNTVALSEKQALNFALTKVGATKYKWENLEEENHMKLVLNNPNFSYKPVGELCIIWDVEPSKKSIVFNYAYKFAVYAEAPLYKANLYIDATTGEVIRETNLICTIDAVGTANTKYSGTQAITTDSYASGFRLRESGRGGGIETYNLANSSTYTNTDFTNTTNTWTITTSNQAATDAHFGAESTYDYFWQKHSRNSIDGNGYKLLSYVHYSTNYVNAFWDGLRMTYGDGQVSQGFNIMTALDVCGHEITHGVVENTANLGNGEAGALNEAFADIFGTCVEWFARPSQHDWFMGKDISTTSTPLRDMSNPKSQQQPDTYLGTYWDNTGEVHTNDGPCIYWFYLLSVGGSGSNDNNSAYNVSGISMEKAAAIAYRALAFYMTPTTNYANVRNYTIQAAKDLYGACSNELIQTTNAWYAVGVGAEYVPGNIGANFIANQGVSCSLPTVVDFNNTTNSGLTYTWHFGDGATDSSINPTHTYTANGTYSVSLVAKGCLTGSKDSITKLGFITIDSPIDPIASDENVCANTSATLTATGNGIINWYDSPSKTILLGTGNTLVTPVLNSSNTYYAVNTITHTPIYGGPANNTTFGGGSNFNSNSDRYLIFDVFKPSKLKTVTVVASSTGNRTIELRDYLGTVIQSTVVNIASGTQTVTLNFDLLPGTNYQLGTSGTLVNMWRNNTNTGTAYPFNVGGLVSITTADAGNAYYYYFYNWEVQQADCETMPLPVNANVSVCTGLNNAVIENSITMYPNPASEKLSISLTEELKSAIKSIEIYDALGKVVKIVTVTNIETNVTISNLAQGVYTCRFINTSNQTIIKRFVKE